VRSQLWMQGWAAWLHLCVLYTSRRERPCEPYTQWLGQFTWQHSYKYVTTYVYTSAHASVILRHWFTHRC
jgi:hypothetical protein